MEKIDNNLKEAVIELVDLQELIKDRDNYDMKINHMKESNYSDNNIESVENTRALIQKQIKLTKIKIITLIQD